MSYTVRVQNRAGGVTPLTVTSQSPLRRLPALSVLARKVTPSPVPIGSSPDRAIAARE